MEFDGAKDRFDAEKLRALLLCAGSGAEGTQLFCRSERAVNTGRTTGVISIASVSQEDVKSLEFFLFLYLIS